MLIGFSAEVQEKINHESDHFYSLPVRDVTTQIQDV